MSVSEFRRSVEWFSDRAGKSVDTRSTTDQNGPMSTTHETDARDRKARAIALHLHANRITADDADRFTYGKRQQWATKAGQKVPSPQTWQAVVAKLTELEKAAADAQADPFDGLPS